MSIATLFSKLVDWLRQLLSSSQPSTMPPVAPVEPTTPATKNYYPEIIRISTGSLELNGSRVGPEEHDVTIKRKQLLYAAVACEVQCNFTLKMFLDGKANPENNVKNGGIPAVNSGKKENNITVGWPETNGYPLGKHEALIVLYDQNGRVCDSYSMTLNVVMP